MSKKTTEYVAYSGEKFTIEWYYNKNHKSDAFEYYQSLDDDERDAIISLFKLMGNDGKILNPTKFRSEGDKIKYTPLKQIRNVFYPSSVTGKK